MKEVNPKWKLALVLVLVGCLVVGIVAAATLWSQNITWQYQSSNPSFTVYDTDGAEIADSSTLDLGTITQGYNDTQAILYNVTNTGNIPVTVYAHASVTGGSNVAVFTPTYADLNIGASTMFTLDLTINEAGSCTVTFDFNAP